MMGAGHILVVHPFQPAMKITIAWVAVVLLFPIILLFWATESQQQRICRLRTAGWTQQRIADHLHISRSKVQRTLASRRPQKVVLLEQMP